MSDATLPFKVRREQETIEIGNDRTGILVFPVYHDLTVSENAWMAQQNAENNAFSHTSRLALKIAKLERCKPVEAHEFVTRILARAMGAEVALTPKQEDWTVKYVRELEACALKMVDITVAQQNLLVTALIRGRLPGMENWTVTDTAGQPTELIEMIHQFALSEKGRGVAPSVEGIQEELEEALGKSRRARGKSRSRRTGATSTTGFAASTPEIPTSLPSDSDSSPAPTPSAV